MCSAISQHDRYAHEFSHGRPVSAGTWRNVRYFKDSGLDVVNPWTATCAYLVDHGQSVVLASYDWRMTAVARAMGISLFDL